MPPGLTLFAFDAAVPQPVLSRFLRLVFRWTRMIALVGGGRGWSDHVRALAGEGYEATVLAQADAHRGQAILLPVSPRLSSALLDSATSFERFLVPPVPEYRCLRADRTELLWVYQSDQHALWLRPEETREALRTVPSLDEHLHEARGWDTRDRVQHHQHLRWTPVHR